jgi:XRE family aerobic/anaerobic benzoate catabolism transcriptional regulator
MVRPSLQADSAPPARNCAADRRVLRAARRALEPLSNEGEPTEPASILEVIARQVRARRQARGWTQNELATRSGVSLRFLGQLEAATGNISVERLADLAAALETSVTALVHHDNQPAIESASPLHRRIDALAREHGVDAVDHLIDVVSATLGGESGAPRVALLGIRGAGKSTIGRHLARQLDVDFFELDALVEREAGMPLGALFELHGEASYRGRERAALEQLIREAHPLVLATGGSIVTEPVHHRLLKETFTTIWLRARPEDHWERVVAQGDFRPMRENPQAMDELRALFEARRPLYEQADHIVDTVGRSVDEVALEIATLVTHAKRSATPA